MRFTLFLLALISAPAFSTERVDHVSGSWTYRSFHNDPSPVGNDAGKLQRLLFGEGRMELSVDQANSVTGVLSFGGDYALDISGSVSANEVIAFTAKGRSGTLTNGWVYAYQASAAHSWSNAVGQVPALLGSVIRVVPHNGGPAGVTASFIMVKR